MYIDIFFLYISTYTVYNVHPYLYYQVCGVNYMSTLMAQKWLAPVYRYIVNFTIVPPEQDLRSDASPQDIPNYDASGEMTEGFNYAYHGIDMRHFFAEHEEDTARDGEFVKAVRNVVFEFVRNGGITDWQPFPETTGVLSSHMTKITGSQYHHEKCEFWKVNYFFPRHAWMN